MAKTILTLFLFMAATLVAAKAPVGQCPALLSQTMPKLHSTQQIDLCEAFKGKPLLIVNTASYCGFTGQFRGLEALYKTYKEQGLEILGVPSNSFNQEAKAEAETASVCYKNYGVTFTMTSAQTVTGASAHPLYQELARQSGVSPRWNFHKYLVNSHGQVVAEFPSHTKPSDVLLRNAIETELAAMKGAEISQPSEAATKQLAIQGGGQ